MGVIGVVDAKHVKFSNLITKSQIRDKMKQNQKMVKKNYSHVQDRVFVINTGTGMKAIWNVIKIFAPKQMKKKITFLGSDYLKELRQEIEDDKIPSKLGGSGQYPIGSYPNFWDKQLQESYKNKTLSN